MYKTVATLLILSGMYLGSAYAGSTLGESIDKTIDILEEYGQAQGDSIPRNVFHECKGLVILSVYKAAFIIGAQGGEGLVVIRKCALGNFGRGGGCGISGGGLRSGLCALAEYRRGGQAVHAEGKLHEQCGC
ncbi:MAG: hypothetical protein NTU87_05370 [Verrucomicrobia bacterium]|nr:hypothetical protein [Verrucomicrobiota bacterium]